MVCYLLVSFSFNGLGVYGGKARLARSYSRFRRRGGGHSGAVRAAVGVEEQRRVGSDERGSAVSGLQEKVIYSCLTIPTFTT